MSFTNQRFELPSKGLIYPPDSPLRKGVVEMHPMTAKEEDLISDPNNTSKGFSHMADVLMQALSIDKFNPDDLLDGDRNALLVYTRITAWGSSLEFKKEHPIKKVSMNAVVDLSKIEEKHLTIEPVSPGINEFSYQLPYSGAIISFKLLTAGDHKELDKEREDLKKIDGQSHIKTTLLRAKILSVDGDNTELGRYKFIETMFAADIRAFERYEISIRPDVLFKADVTYEDGHVEGGVKIPFVEWDTFLPDWREGLSD